MRKLVFIFLTCSYSYVTAQATLNQLLPQELFSEGEDMMLKEQFGAARQYFERYISTEDTQYKQLATYNIAICALRLYHLDGEQLMMQFVDQYPNSPKALLARFELGNYFFRDRNYKKAIPNYEAVTLDALAKTQQQEYTYKLAYSYFALRKFSQAEPLFTTLKKSKSEYQSMGAYYSGYIAYEQKKYDQAISDLSVAASNKGFSNSATIMLVSVYYQKEDYDGLINFLEPKLSKDTRLAKNPQLAVLLGEAYYFKKVWKKAITSYKNAGNKLNTEAAYHYAVCLEKQQNLQEAIRVLKSIAGTENNTSIAASYLLGNVYLKLNDKVFALGAFLQLIDVAPEEIAQESAYLATKLLYQLARYTQSVDQGKMYLAKYHGNAHASEVSELIANALVQTNDYSKALAYLESLPNLSDQHQLAYQKAAYYLGVNQFNAKKFKLAVASFSKSLLKPINPELVVKANIFMGEAYSMGRRFKEATPFYQKAIQSSAISSSDMKLTWYGLGYALYNQQKYLQAKMYFAKYIENVAANEVNYGTALLRLADCEYIAKNYSKALNYYQRVVKGVFMGKDYAYYQIGVIEHIQSKYSEALMHLDHLLEVYSRSAYRDDAVFEKGNILLEMGNYGQAALSFTSLIVTYPNSRYIPFALEKRALANFNQRNFVQTINDYELFLEKYPYHPSVQSVLLGLQQAYTEEGNPSQFSATLSKFKNKNPDMKGLEDVEFSALIGYYNEGLYTKAALGFKNFIVQYPNHPKLQEAKFILAEALYRQQKNKEALVYYKELAGDKTYEQMYRVYERLADLLIQNKKYPEAVHAYHLFAQTSISNNQLERAYSGLMKSFFYETEYDSALKYTGYLIDTTQIQDENVVEALLYRGKCYLAKGNFEEAQKVLSSAASQANSAVGAEAQYLLGEMLFLQNKFDESNEALYIIPQKYGNYTAWLDKAFLLIADNFIGKEEYFQARATLESIIANSIANITVSKAKDRLAELNEIEARKAEEAVSDTLQVLVKDSIPDE